MAGKEAFVGLCETKFGWDELNPQGFVKLEMGCSIVGCVPHHRWMQDLVDRIPLQSPTEQLALAFPFLTKVTFEYPEVHRFPPETFYPVTWSQYANGGKKSLRKEVLPEGTYAVHRWSSCWFEEGLKPRL